MNSILILVAAIPVMACASGAATITASGKMHQTLETKRMVDSRSDRVEIWVTLTEMPVAIAPKGQLGVVKRQQDAVMARLRELGATEMARVTTSNNALAVAIDPAKVPEVKRISGVRSVSAVQHIEREPLPGPPPTR